MNDLCAACLCTGRNLCYIAETSFYSIYSQILNEIPVYDLSEVYMHRICWECCSALRRFQNFKRQVKSSYTELLQYSQQGQDTKVITNIPRLQSTPVTCTDYPEIKTEFDFLDTTLDGQHSQEFVQHSGQDIVQHSGQDYVEPLSHLNQHRLNSTEFIKHEDVLKDDGEVLKLDDDMKTFVNDLDVKKTLNRKKKNKVEKVKTKKEKKKKSKLKNTQKVRRKKQKLVENKIKSDVESSHEFDDNCLSPYEDKTELDIGEEKIEDKLEDNEKVCNNYQNNELEELDTMANTISNNVIDETVQRLQRQCVTVQRKVVPPCEVKVKVSSEKPQCAECGKVFSSKKTLRYHLNVLHKGNNRYPCPRCGKVYQWKSNLGRHLRSHKARDTGELYCATCDKRFASVATYRQHLNVSKQHVSENEFSYSCDDCGKKFVNKTRLRDHIDWEHLQKIKFRCQLCDKPFKCHTSLYVHMKNVHRDKGLKDNLCHVCGKSYQNAAKLRYHIVAMHTTQTPYQCEQCTAAFGWYSSLYRHVREVHYKMKVHPSKSKKTKKRPPEPLPPLQPHMPPPPHLGMP